MTCDNCIPCLEGSPFLNLSAEGPEPFFFRALGWCCDGQMLEYESLVSYFDAQVNMQRLLQTDCPACSDAKKYCADALCSDGSLLTTVCVTTSQADADALAQSKADSMAGDCADKSALFSSTCSCPNGTNSQTVYSNLSQALADSECAAIPKHCNESANQAQSCSVPCKDGTAWTFVVPAGSYYADTLEQANAIAYSAACLMAFMTRQCCNLTRSLPDGSVGTPYSKTVTTSLSNPVWTVVTGTLPPGLTLDPLTGVISGTPTVAGTFTFTIQAFK